MRPHLANPTLQANSRRELIELLNATLASALDLSMQAKHAHWNIRGPDFLSFHEFFDELAERLHHFADVLAERATALGGTAEGTARLVGKNSRIDEYDLDAVTSAEHVEALTERMSVYAGDLGEAAVTAARLGDLATEDIFVEQLRQLDLDAWFLDASRPVEREPEREAARESPPPLQH
jgi:starvation-inducible DNA-binding protein